MIYYTKVDHEDYGLLIFKVIGAESQKHADEIISETVTEQLIKGQTIRESNFTICPLFRSL